jgi:hypothetical protein
VGQGELADAGVALGPRLEAAAEPAGLITGVDDLEDGQGTIQVDATAAQPGQLPNRRPVSSKQSTWSDQNNGNFIDAIRSDRPVRVGTGEARAVLAVVLSLYKSAASGSRS